VQPPTPTPTATPKKDTAGDGGHLTKPPKDHARKHDHSKTHRRHHRGGSDQETAIDDQRPVARSGRRLRAGLRAR
jgi:hypothetical protein